MQAGTDRGKRRSECAARCRGRGQHYDVPINYVGLAESWDAISVKDSIEGRDCVLRYKRDGRVVAVASIYRDIDSLRAEVEMERASL
jgi:hypothetical protein